MNTKNSQTSILLNQLKNFLPFIDLALADFLLKKFDAPLESKPLLWHLSQASRAGHLCIKVDEQGVFPKPENVWEVNHPISAEEWHEIEQFIQESVHCLSLPLVAETSCETPENLTAPICRFNNLFYFQKYWLYESFCLEKISGFSTEKPTLQLNSESVLSSLKSLNAQNNLMEEQAQAIAQLENQTLTLISGGPGTGKTYTAGLLIQVFWNSLTKEQKEKCQIALAAPTGKAAANLQKSLNKAVNALADFKPITACTLHALLGIKFNGEVKNDYINADLLVLDECSMIDIRMMYLLFKALKPGARLIMLGDPFQLPSIGAGAIFADMIKLCPVQTIELKKCLRTDLGEIVVFAQKIKNGESQAALHLLDSSKQALSFQHLSKDLDPSQIQQKLWEKFHPYLDVNSPSIETFSLFKILSPLRKGILGVEQINQFFYHKLLKKCCHKENLVLPIIITANDYTQELFNGDMGLLICKDSTHGLQAGDYALFDNKRVPALLLPPFEYAFCMSIHKSQGSEFENVLLLLPEEEHCQREHIYTAVTRTRKSLEIWGTPEAFEKAVSLSSSRLSKTTH